MRRILLALAAASVLSSPAFAAAKIGVSMDKFDDNFLTVLRNGMADYAKTLPGVTLQIEDAKDDVSKQLSQVQNFIANGVDATQDGLAAMKAGDLKVTVFQDAAGQGKGAVDAALALAAGKPVEKKVYIPFQLVTPANMDQFMKKN